MWIKYPYGYIYGYPMVYVYVKAIISKESKHGHGSMEFARFDFLEPHEHLYEDKKREEAHENIVGHQRKDIWAKNQGFIVHKLHRTKYYRDRSKYDYRFM